MFFRQLGKTAVFIVKYHLGRDNLLGFDRLVEADALADAYFAHKPLHGVILQNAGLVRFVDLFLRHGFAKPLQHLQTFSVLLTFFAAVGLLIAQDLLRCHHIQEVLPLQKVFHISLAAAQTQIQFHDLSVRRAPSHFAFNAI